MIFTLIQLIIFLFSILLLLSGIWLRSKLLHNNTCKMTMTHNLKSFVDVSSLIHGPKLYKYITISDEKSKVKSQKDKKALLNQLNVQPVIFINGHLGSVDQVRSFSSYIHNDDNYFQYFTIDFLSHNYAGIHGSYIIDQAIFLNDAIKSIQSLYYNKYPENEFKIMVIAHSIGGMVARTALLLNNHPIGCVISDIILLSSPNVRSPFGIDVSLDVLFDKVNHAWQSSFYYTSQSCKHNNISASANSSVVSSDWNCPLCVPSTRVYSFTGGVLDAMVNPSLTYIHHLLPYPKNITLQRSLAKGKSASQLSKVLSIIYIPIRLIPIVYTYVTSFYNNTTNKSNDQIDISANETCVSEFDCLSNSNDSDISNNTIEITNQWNDDIIPYFEPSIVSIYISMLRRVNDSIDHKSILWCKQFLSSLSKAMKLTSNQTTTNLIDHLNIISLSNESTIKSSDPMISHQQRVKEYINLSNYLKREKKIVLSKDFIPSINISFVNLSTVYWGLALEYISRYVYSLILPAYLLILLLVALIPVVRELSGYSNESIDTLVEGLYRLLPNQLYDSTIVYAVVYNILPVSLSKQIIRPIVFITIVTISSSKLLYDLVFSDNIDFIDRYVYLVSWISILVLGLVVVLIGNVIVYLARQVIRYLGKSLVFIIKQKSIRKSIKKYRNFISTYTFIYLSTALFIITYAITASRSNSLPISLHLFSGLLISQYVMVTLSLTVLLVYRHSVYTSDYLLIYLPTILLQRPMYLFTYKILFQPLDEFIASSSIYLIFGPELINNCIIIFLINFHLYLLIIYGDITSKESAWLVNLFGKQTIIEMSLDLNLNNNDLNCNSNCIHFDGGKNAILEKFTNEKTNELSNGVYVGPTYRVTYCNCSLDKTLKDYTQYCEYCLCRNCGGKNLPIHLKSSKFNVNTGDVNLLESLDLTYVIIVFILLVALITYVNDRCYRISQILGIYAFISITRIIFNKSNVNDAVNDNN